MMIYCNKNTNIDELINILDENGAVVIKSLYNEKLIKSLNKQLDKSEPKALQNYFDLPWGYGNLLDDNNFKELITNKYIQKSIERYLKESDYLINHIVVNEKSALVGFDVEWHQEVFNMNTFAPGCNPKDHNKNFLQIFVALDNQVSDSGGLGIYLKSHKLGLLESIDIISPSLTHKRHVSYKDMKKLSENCELVYPDLNAGDCLLFSSLLVHGSSKNFSSNRRRSAVIQAKSKNIPSFNQSIYDEEVKHRHDFVINNLNKQIKKLGGANLYSDLAKGN